MCLCVLYYLYNGIICMTAQQVPWSWRAFNWRGGMGLARCVGDVLWLRAVTGWLFSVSDTYICLLWVVPRSCLQRLNEQCVGYTQYDDVWYEIYILCIDCLSLLSLNVWLSVIIYNTAQCIRKAHIRREREREIPLGNWYHVGMLLLTIRCTIYMLHTSIYTHISQYML